MDPINWYEYNDALILRATTIYNIGNLFMEIFRENLRKEKLLREMNYFSRRNQKRQVSTKLH